VLDKATKKNTLDAVQKSTNSVAQELSPGDGEAEK
jgi:hypothetical protein